MIDDAITELKPRSWNASAAPTPALPHHLPVQIITADHIAAPRPHLQPAVWNARYAPVLDQLTEIVKHYLSNSCRHPHASVAHQCRTRSR
jgi:hypothetical protein